MAKALANAGASIDFVLPYKAHHPDTEFMKIYHTTDLDPLHKMGMGAYDTHLDLTDTDTKSPAVETTHAVGLRAIQKKYISYVEKHVVAMKPDVIHAHDWLTYEAGIAAKRATGAPLVVHVHATEFDRAGNSQGNPIIHEIELEGLLMADRIIAVSAITKQIIIDRYQIPADKIEVIHNSIDCESTRALEATDTYLYASRMKQEGYTVVSTLGRLTLQKGLDHFLRASALACAKYDRFVFIIAGDGEQRDELIQLSAELGISDKVLFTGFVRGQRWRDVYAVSDIFVMSSVSEPFGLTALEAAASHTALLISKQSGVGEVLSNILRFDYWDERLLADQMVNLASSSALMHDLSNAVAEEFDRFSWNDVAEKCMKQYERVRILA
ncbi:glycosyltransferase family 4 protein [Pedobacter sp.]|nr:glycosyltransferase family 4 protein [Candidatus Saccharibacteria bacterium]